MTQSIEGPNDLRTAPAYRRQSSPRWVLVATIGLLAILGGLGLSITPVLTFLGGVVVEVARSVMQEVTGGVAGFDPLIRYHTFGTPASTSR